MVPRIAVVEDHSFYRKGICLTLKRMKFVEFGFEAENGIEFLEKQRKNPADIVLLDIVLPQLSGYEILKAIKKEFKTLKVIVLTMMDQDDEIQKFIECGINGYLLKNIDHEVLEAALKAVIKGNTYFSVELMNFFTRKLHEEKKITPLLIKLTNREKEILQLIYEGYSSQEIADKLFLSLRTINNHRYKLKIKTSSKNTAGLIAFGLKNKLLT